MRISSLCLFLAAGLPSLFANVIVFSDGDFQTGWSSTTITDQNTTGTTTYVTTNPATGGNPNFFRQETHTSVQASGAPTLAALHFGNLNSAANYNPSVQGAITSLSFRYDLLHIDDTVPGFRQVIVGYGLLAEQNGRYYRAYFGDHGPVGASWTPFSHAGLTSASFHEIFNSGTYPHVNAASNPDFSAAGSNINFGYVVANGFSGAINGNTGIDNWQVTITNDVPEPATFAIAGAALLGIAMLRRRSNRC
jgi:hypothetical protein